ncbi:MAG: hypothetical protein U9O64_04215 [Campylobacterota bacterium]|nr:hypothetical protein [Campylobacterota bacterium]
MQNSEPTLHGIEDYEGKESKEKRLTVWIVILSGLLIGSVYTIISSNTSVSDLLVDRETTGIIKY